MSFAATFVVWLLLLLLVGGEFLLARVPGVRAAVPFVGVASAMLVALTYMRLSTSGGLAKAFAVAGGFWVLVMLCLGSLDTWTRRDLPAPRLTPSSAPRLAAPSTLP